MNETIKTAIGELVESNPELISYIQDLAEIKKLTDLNLKVILELHKYQAMSMSLFNNNGYNVYFPTAILGDIKLSRQFIEIIASCGTLKIPWTAFKSYDNINKRFLLRRKDENHYFQIKEI